MRVPEIESWLVVGSDGNSDATVSSCGEVKSASIAKNKVGGGLILGDGEINIYRRDSERNLIGFDGDILMGNLI